VKNDVILNADIYVYMMAGLLPMLTKAIIQMLIV